ncbi:hypothetical protein Clacol_002970 [Clathrus columnatus]|uniref:Amidase domain-containing protein n=1 Tax=Clathrus columnatus TaxID=1419009 RepID=A0AAV5A862_9AGAM|nr:hypothetical protein Clacol_002970 [Clathrus columnatus]
MPPSLQTPFLNYPTAVETNGQGTEFKYKSQYFPVLTGFKLNILSYIATSLSPVQSILWNAAESGTPAKLERKGVLKNVVPCFDPTVIPLVPRDSSLSAYDPFLHDANSTQSQFYSALDYVEAYKSRKTTPIKVVERILDILSTDSTKESYFISLVPRHILLAEAAKSTERYVLGTPLPLDGVPLAVKDEVDVKGLMKTFGLSLEQVKRRFKDGGEPSTYTSFCVQKLLDAGMLLLGKTNMHELGLDTTNDNPYWGTPCNPYNPNYYPGGSSGGSGASVGAGLVPIAVGADGGGSVRVPSAYNGAWGLKPSHGRVSTSPSPSFAPSVVVVGPIAATISDLEIAYHIMATPDTDGSLSGLFAPPRSLSLPAQKRIGIYNPWIDASEPKVKILFNSSLTLLKEKMGYQVEDITLPYLSENQIAHRLVIMSELTSILCSAGQDITGLAPHNRILASVASRTSSHDLISANRLRTQMMQHLSHLFTTYPGLIILSPTTPHPGVRIPSGAGLKGAYGLTDATNAVESMIYVFLANWTGCPSISVPCGYVDVHAGEMPVGLMGMSEWGSEDLLLRFGRDWDEIWSTQRRRGKGWVDVLNS